MSPLLFNPNLCCIYNLHLVALMLHTCTLPGPDATFQIMMLFVPPLLGHDGDPLLYIMATGMILSALFKSRLY